MGAAFVSVPLPRRSRLASSMPLGSSADMNAAPTTPTAAGGPSDGNAPDGAKVTERHSNLGPTDRSAEALG